MISTADLQALTRPMLTQVFDALGHDLVIVRPVTDDATYGGTEADYISDPVRGILMPATSYTQKAAAGAGLPIPVFEAYLPFDTDLASPGFYVMHEGTRYNPVGDARDEGGQQVVWVLGLSSPGQVSDG